MKVINTPRALGTSLIALGCAVGFAHSAAASSLNGLYSVKEICKITVTDIQDFPNDNRDTEEVRKVYGTHTEYGARLEEVPETGRVCDLESETDSGIDLEGAHCKDVKALIISKDGNKKYFYTGTAGFGQPSLDEESYRPTQITGIGLDQCYSLDEHTVSYVPTRIEFYGGPKNFVGHSESEEERNFVELPMRGEGFTTVTVECKSLLVKTRDRSIKQLLSKHALPEEPRCFTDLPS